MATNIEQIFRSFVVSKFREIQQELSRQALPRLFCSQGIDRASCSLPYQLYSETPSFPASGPATAPPGPGIHFPPPPPPSAPSLPSEELRSFRGNPRLFSRTELRSLLFSLVWSSPTLQLVGLVVHQGRAQFLLSSSSAAAFPLPLSASADFAGRCL